MSKEYYQALKTHIKNKNYVVGRNFEYRCIHKYRERGWYTNRSFGSKTPADFIGYLNGIGHLVQCKWSRKNETKPESYDELTKLIVMAKKCGAIPVFAGIHKNRRLYFMNLLNNEEFTP